MKEQAVLGWDCGVSLKICTTLSEKSVFSPRERFSRREIKQDFGNKCNSPAPPSRLGMDLLFQAELQHIFFLLFHLEKLHF